MILAVTGATGFVGSHVLDAATASGVTVRALARKPQPARNGVTWVTGALDSPAALDSLCLSADVLLHIAGAVNVPSRAAFAAANIAGTQAVVDAAVRAGVQRFIHVSSLAAREPALSSYGWSKAGAEAIVQAAPIPAVIVRPPGVYGPRDTEMLEAFRMAASGLMLLPPPGQGSWVFVSDLADLLLKLAAAADFPDKSQFEVDDGTAGGLSHVALGGAIAAAVGRPSALKVSAPRWLLRLAARGDRLVRGDRAKLTPDRAAYMSHPNWVSDPDKRPSAALWTPRTGHEAGLAETARWYRAEAWLD